MEKILVAIFVFLLSASVYAQKTGKVVYEVNMDRFKESTESENSGNPSDELMVRTAELAEGSTLELLYNEQASLFRHQKSLVIDDNEFAAFAKELVCQGEYYTDLNKNKSLFITEFGGQMMNVVEEIKKIDWLLTKETKKIGKYVCYKATYNKEIAEKGEEVVAWYTTDIPVSYGPLEYGGSLPGLILELDHPIALYIATEVEFNKNKNISWPKNITTISREEYDQKTNAAWQSIQKD